MKQLSAVVLVAVLALASAACSSDGNHLPKAEFIRQAKPICEAKRKAIKAQAAKVDFKDPAAVPAFIQSASDQMLDEVAALRALGVPKEGGDQLNRALDDLEQQFTAWSKSPGQVAEAGATLNVSDAGKVFADYGLPECDTGITATS